VPAIALAVNDVIYQIHAPGQATKYEHSGAHIKKRHEVVEKMLFRKQKRGEDNQVFRPLPWTKAGQQRKLHRRLHEAIIRRPHFIWQLDLATNNVR